MTEIALVAMVEKLMSLTKKKNSNTELTKEANRDGLASSALSLYQGFYGLLIMVTFVSAFIFYNHLRNPENGKLFTLTACQIFSKAKLNYIGT